MQQLSKIILMNSATIPYQEFMLDGNIHFIGTQGVGKSTVLRAILFFTQPIAVDWGFPKNRNLLLITIFRTSTLILFTKWPGRIGHFVCGCNAGRIVWFFGLSMALIIVICLLMSGKLLLKRPS